MDEVIYDKLELNIINWSVILGWIWMVDNE